MVENKPEERAPIIEVKTYERPAKGEHRFQIVSVSGLKEYKTKDGDIKKFAIKCEVTDCKDSKDEPFYVWQSFTPSLHPKANLAKFMASMQIRHDGKTFDSESLNGKKFKAYVVHNKSTDGTQTFANLSLDTVESLEPLSSQTVEF